MKDLLFGMKEKKRGKDEAKNRVEESRSRAEDNRVDQARAGIYPGVLSASGIHEPQKRTRKLSEREKKD
jgi:hypothetical protein